MLQDEVLVPGWCGLTSADCDAIKSAYKTVWHFLLDTRDGAYSKGVGLAADEVHSQWIEYPHLLMSFQEYHDYFMLFWGSGHFRGTYGDIQEGYLEYARKSVEVWWSHKYRSYRMQGLSPYLASFFAESDILYVPEWGADEYALWTRGSCRPAAMLDNYCLVTQRGRERPQNHCLFSHAPYAGETLEIRGPAGLDLKNATDQGMGRGAWYYPLFMKIPMLPWILSLSAPELYTLYNLRPPEGYTPTPIPNWLQNYIPYRGVDFSLEPYARK